ncbi:MAG: ABC transporter ATP-binding protein [Actinobacteria bacterium]|nr:ABC transporter ATP-binding protein [Actinomycetota bacterium]
MSDQPAVRITNVSKRYGRRAPTLLDINLVVEAGTIVTLAGSNGSGKSTLLRCVAGLARFTGAIEVRGRDVGTDDAFRGDVGYLPQSVMFPSQSTVDETLAFFAQLRGTGDVVLPLADGFLPPRSALVGTLSGGQRQRLAMAIALLGNPAVLLLDEPVSNLDESGRESVWTMLRELKVAGVTALIASPSPADLAGIGDRTVMLHDGRVVDDRGKVAS